MVGYLFAGQGSQYAGMGKDLYDANPESRAIFDKADKTLGFEISKLCFQGPVEELTKTQNCQPAIVTMTIAALEAFKTTNPQSSAQYTAGLSLGEYSALVASGSISFEDAVHLVRRRGEFMEEEAAKFPGKMASILGMDLTVIKEICKNTGAEVANINSPGQIVISGSPKSIEDAKSAAEAQGAKRVLMLELSGAFHSSFMKGASLKLAKELDNIKINKPTIPIISNVTALPAQTPQEIKDNLIRQVASGVLWDDSMRFMLNKGIANFIEFGPGKVLKGLMRRINETAQVVNVEKNSDLLILKKE